MRLPGKFACLGMLALSGLALALPAAPAGAQTPAPATPPAAAAPPDEQPAETKRIGDWTVACIQPKDAPKKMCQAVQVLEEKDSGSRVMQILVGYADGSSEPLAMFILPLGYLLPPGAKVELDGQPIGALAAQRCTSKGCLAPLPLTADLLAKFKAGKAGKVGLSLGNDQVRDLPFSLKGFSAAFAELNKS